MKPIYYAHSKGSDKKDWERLIVHLQNVAARCKAFAEVFGCGVLGEFAGLLHDIGKYASEFVLRLEGKAVKMDHSTAGAIAADKHVSVRLLARMIQYVIVGHHGGLPNFHPSNEAGSLRGRLLKTVNDYSAYQTEVVFPETEPIWPENIEKALWERKDSASYSVFFLIKMLFSCLVDADFLETERFMSPKKGGYRSAYAPLSVLSEKLYKHLEYKKGASQPTQLNMNRNAILTACISKTICKPGLFKLAVPTGGGKTLASLAFAMRHALEHGMDRIIYVIPYTSIIEQTAEIFKEILGEGNVLEHHSNFEFLGDFDYEDSTGKHTEEIAYSIKLASENWDMPIIVTTNVQFFESIYANKTTKSRKVHNIANSVLIFDEAQLLPVNYLKPSLECLCELCENYHSSVVLCTATQPAIEKYLRKGISPVELVEKDVFDPRVFKRVEYENLRMIAKESLVDQLLTHQQFLCVVNSKKLARSIFEDLPKGCKYHLSGNMCAQHRSEKLQEIKKKLELGEPACVVTTQLIEAGVDIDFPVVYREIAGVDSLIQAAGRCNREGRLDIGRMFIFQIEGESRRGYLDRTAGFGSETLETFQTVDSEDAIKFYFDLLYGKELTDAEKILFQCQNQEFQYPYKDIAEKFKLIKNNTVPIFVPYDDNAKQLIRMLESDGGSHIARKLQRYTVDVYGSPDEKSISDFSQFYQLLNSGSLRVIRGLYYVLNIDSITQDTFYSTDVGLKIEGNECIC